jgi:hypothetical protein
VTKDSNIPNTEKLAFLKEHLPYEREMLGYTFNQLHGLAQGLAWNTH